MFDFIKNTKEIIDYKNISNSECNTIINNIYIKKDNNLIDSHVYKELEFFYDYKGGTNSVFSKINFTETLIGELYLKKKLLEPVVSYKKINDYNVDFIEKSKQFLLYIKPNQKCLLSFMKPLDNIYENIYLPNIALRTLKTDELKNMVQKMYMIFNIGLPFYTIFSPVIFLLIFFVMKNILNKYLIGKLRYLINISFMGLMELNIFKIDSLYALVKTGFSLLFFVYNVYSSIKFSLMSYILYNKIKEKLDILKNITEKVYEIYKDNNLGIKTLEKIKIDIGSIYNSGYVMLKYKSFIKNPKLINYIKFIGKLDYTLCRYKLIKKGFTKSNFIKSKKPLVIFKGVSNPYFDDKFIKNDITIDNNIILTGVNAGGKSTFIKTILINIILSQTIGICCADYMLITPFSYITSSLNKFDEKGKHSLFQSEIRQISTYIDKMNNLKKNTYGFLVIDEIFSGTNMNDAEISADIYCNKLSEIENSLSLTTTHLNSITKKRERFRNYKMIIKRDNSNKLIYTYKIENGVNNDSVILDLLVKVI